MDLDNSLINKNTRNEHLRNILILLIITLVFGTYLILTTVMVSRDSIAYLYRAQCLQENPDEESIVYIYRTRSLENDPDVKIKPADVLAERPSGYEVLILLSYRFFYAITGNSSVNGWIWAAQGLTLLCRALAIVALYLVGCQISNRRHSFWGCVILLLLPESAHWGSDVLREWPYLLFMALSVLTLLYGIQKNRMWWIALTGIFAGIGYLIRLESIQLVFLGLLVLFLFMFKPPQYCTRFKILLLALLLIVCFSLPILIYAGYSGQITNEYLKHYIEKVFPTLSDSEPNEEIVPVAVETGTQAENEITENVIEVTKGQSLFKFAYELFKDAGELLIWFYLPFWIIGIYMRLRSKADPIIRCIVAALILMGIGMLLMRYFYKEAIVTQRWVLPLIAITAFYIHSGIEQFGICIERKKAPNLQNPKKWIRILVTIGILICLVKVVEPLGSGNRAYREAANWIKENTHKLAWVYTHDRRIPFYAERGFIEYHEHQHGFDLEPYDATCLIVPSDDKRVPDNPPEGLILETTFGQENGKGGFYIYRYDLN